MKKFTKGAIAAALLVSAATPAFAADSTVDTTLYSDLLAFVQAQFSFEGAEYSAFQDLFPAGSSQLAKLSDAFAKLNSAQLTLTSYLQAQITRS